MQRPLGHKDASIAEHLPVQLIPRPQVTVVIVMLGWQHPTWRVSLNNVKTESKKVFELSERHETSSFGLNRKALTYVLT